MTLRARAEMWATGLCCKEPYNCDPQRLWHCQRSGMCVEWNLMVKAYIAGFKAGRKK